MTSTAMTRTAWARLSHALRASARAFNALFGRSQSNGLNTRWTSPAEHEVDLVKKVLGRAGCDVAIAGKVLAMLGQTPHGDLARASVPRHEAVFRKGEAVLWAD